jgi:DICT domain-containing protein
MLLSSDDIQAASPRLDAEARQLAQRKLAAERDVDSKVDALNARLLSMIRQGREALGTKVEVEMLDEMDTGVGWEDDD